MTSFAELTQPFEVVNSQPQNVRDKYLEGIPYKNKNFPGPFLGVTPQQMDSYVQMQQGAVQNYGLLSQQPLGVQAAMYPSFNDGEADCETVGRQIPMVPPVQQGRQPGPQNSPGIEFSQNINRQRVPQQEGYTNPMTQVAMAGMYHPEKRITGDRKEDFNGVEDFYDESITNPQSQTGFGIIVPKFSQMPEGTKEQVEFRKCSAEGNPLLDIKNRPIEQFSHNNMVPYYGSKLTQNMAVTGVPQAGDNNTCEGVTDGFANATPYRGKLELFTGTDEMWMHKRETGALFSPAEQQTGWVFGTPAFRPDMDRFKTQVWKRHGEKPVESVKVGPGIGIDYTTPAVGGFQQYTRILPNNVSDYKANQLEGRVKGGKWVISSHPTSQYIHGVKKNRPDVQITQARRPTQQGKFATNAPSADSAGITSYIPSVMKGKQSRSDTEQAAGFGQLNLGDSGSVVKRENFQSGPGQGMPCVDFSRAPVGMTMKSHVPQGNQDRSSYTNIRETFRRGAAGYREKSGFWECRDRTQGQEEWGLIMGPARGMVSMSENRDGKYVNYTDRGDVNPYVINVTGTATGAGLWNPNSYQQPAKVTTKETTQFSYAGNVTGKEKNYINTWSDTPKVTTKETTEYSHTGNIQNGKQGFYKNNWETDQPRVTRKETTQYAHAGNASQGGVAFMDRSMFTGSTILPK